VYLLQISNSHYQSYLFKLTRDYQDVFHRYTDEKEYKEKKKQLFVVVTLLKSFESGKEEMHHQTTAQQLF
jgi:hypothetical protein